MKTLLLVLVVMLSTTFGFANSSKPETQREANIASTTVQLFGGDIPQKSVEDRIKDLETELEKQTNLFKDYQKKLVEGNETLNKITKNIISLSGGIYELKNLIGIDPKKETQKPTVKK